MYEIDFEVVCVCVYTYIYAHILVIKAIHTHIHTLNLHRACEVVFVAACAGLLLNTRYLRVVPH